MSIFTLKLIGIISMFTDHLGYILFHNFSFMNYIGRLAFPIFAFCITEGFLHTRNIKKYFLRLFVLGVISQLPYILFESCFTNKIHLNILFTLFLGLLSIFLYEKIYKKNSLFYKILAFFPVIAFSIIAEIFPFDYGWYGICVIFIFYLFKNLKIFMSISFILLTFINYFYNSINTYKIEYIYIIFCVCCSLIFINLYNNKKGKNAKYMFYIFYPVHLIFLYFINYICINFF